MTHLSFIVLSFVERRFDLPPSFPALGARRRDGEYPACPGSRPQGAGRVGRERMFYRRHLRGGQKRGAGVGKTKRGKGTKLMAVADGAGLPIAICITFASPHEVTLVEPTLEAVFAPDPPERLIGDLAYESDPLDEQLAEQGIEMIAPHRRNRKKPRTQDGRKLRRYR